MHPQYPHQFFGKLKRLGHSLVRYWYNESHYDLKCKNCGNIFGIDGGWQKDKGWYRALRYSSGKLYYLIEFEWHEYPKYDRRCLTCKEFMVRDIIT